MALEIVDYDDGRILIDDTDALDDASGWFAGYCVTPIDDGDDALVEYFDPCANALYPCSPVRGSDLDRIVSAECEKVRDRIASHEAAMDDGIDWTRYHNYQSGESF